MTDPIERITPAEVREMADKVIDNGEFYTTATRIASFYYRLADQMEADEERLKGRVSARTRIASWDTLSGRRYYAAIDSDVCAPNGNTPEEAIANLQRAIDEEAERRG